MNQAHRKTRLVAIAIAVSLPTLVTWVYFHMLADSDPKLQQGAYSVGKVVQFGFPLVFVWLILKQRVGEAGLPASDSTPWSTVNSLQFGLAMGLAVAALMFAICWFLFPEAVLENLRKEAEEKVEGFGLNNAWMFVALGLFYALFHSFMEEYYFRWFVFGQLRHVTTLIPAMIISALAFMAHHVIVLAIYFDGLTPLTIFLSLCIAVGGVIWAWQYEKSQSLVGPWISHLLVDAGIFAIGFILLF